MRVIYYLMIAFLVFATTTKSDFTHEGELTPKKGFKLTTTYMAKTWYFSFDLKLSGSISTLTNVLTFQSGSKVLLAVGVWNRNTMLRLCPTLGLRLACQNYKIPGGETEFRIEFYQVYDQTNKVFQYTINVNGKQAYKFNNVRSLDYKNSDVYVSWPGRLPTLGVIKNLFFKNLPLNRSAAIVNDMKTFVGCFKDSILPQRPFSSYIYMRSEIDWNDLGVMVDKCRQAVKSKHPLSKYFGVQFYGECWYDGDTTYNKEGISTNCADGVGKDYALAVYTLNSPMLLEV